MKLRNTKGLGGPQRVDPVLSSDSSDPPPAPLLQRNRAVYTSTPASTGKKRREKAETVPPAPVEKKAKPKALSRQPMPDFFAADNEAARQNLRQWPVDHRTPDNFVASLRGLYTAEINRLESKYSKLTPAVSELAKAIKNADIAELPHLADEIGAARANTQRDRELLERHLHNLQGWLDTLTKARLNKVWPVELIRPYVGATETLIVSSTKEAAIVMQVYRHVLFQVKQLQQDHVRPLHLEVAIINRAVYQRMRR